MDEAESQMGPHVGKGPTGYQRPDARIHEDVCDRFMAHGALDCADIDVKVDGRTVTLSGTVDTRRAKHLAEDIADGVSGVAEIRNQLRVRPREPRDV